MTTTFLAVGSNQCRAPVVMAHNPPGPDMIVCGEATKPGSAYCPECRARLYYRPGKRELNAMDFTIGTPLRPVKMEGRW
jgi:hypothetical protein